MGRAAAARSDDYLSASRRPWVSLLFTAPLVVAYEVGTLLFATDQATGAQTRIVAFTGVNQFFHALGITGRFIPPLTLTAVLLIAHLHRRDPWHVRGQTLLGMAAESIAWAVPLLAIGVMMARYLSLQSPEDHRSIIVGLVLSVGAGLYEELVFRLALVTLLYKAFEHSKVDKRLNIAITLLISSVAFSLYHYLGSEAFSLRSALFRTVAGVFFGAIYLMRGFGVTAGAHAAYDCLVHLFAV